MNTLTGATKTIDRSIYYALAAAVLFGASTPLAKALVGDIPPLVLAGLLYLGSGLGLAVLIAVRLLMHRTRVPLLALPRSSDLRWLAGAILAGGVVAPFLLMVGLTMTTAATASLLLNLEGVLTALIAWFVFRENVDRRVALGMALIVAGGVILSLQPGSTYELSHGVLAVVGACACWAIDNNLTRNVAEHDATFIACTKGLIAGLVNLGLATLIDLPFPKADVVAAAALVGFLGYGVSLVLFVVALRSLGTARTAAYFCIAPFIGALGAVSFGREDLSLALTCAGALMAVGVWLHLSERHEHEHEHEREEHSHSHVHDEHHQHAHDFPWDGAEPHTHAHVHSSMRHSHAHYPDLHHRHEH